MESIFGKQPKMPTPVAPPPVPTKDDAVQKADAADALLKRQGRASTILTSEKGALAQAPVGTKTLLGS